ncbi:hypothetical protein AX14_003646 [Amanita brunnescens Koide BX004]|nr:hypothetical protein AX14_003646 [Amanita brunnescens Koide BX004]
MLPQTLLAIVFIYYAPSLWRVLVNNWKLKSIPTVGTNAILAPFIGPHRYVSHAHEMLREGYDKYRGSFFKLPLTSHWMIVTSGSRFTDEIQHAPVEHLSHNDGFGELMNMNLTIGPETYDSFHAMAIRSTLTKKTREKFSELHDEIVTAFADYIPTDLGDEWVKVKVHATMSDIICRSSNRVFMGLPLCRDPDYMALLKQYTHDIAHASQVINNFPSFLKSIATRLFSTVSGDVKRGMKYLEPFIKERLEQEARYGKDWSEKPDDLLSWLLEAAQGDQRSIRNVTIHILIVNHATVHTITTSSTYILYDLATHPEYVQPMRDEVEAVLRDEGWTYAAINKLSKVDSFIKESLRLSIISMFGLKRKVLKDFTFSDGTTIPAGNLVCVPLVAIQRDPDIYDNPETFDGFRFERMRKKEGNSKHKFASLEKDYPLFGHGRQSCPGRFLAAAELKIMLAHVLINYDIKMANGAGRPANIRIGQDMHPDVTADVLFRKRV